MNQDENYFLDLIRQGESERIEFKTRLLNEHDIAKVLTAFAFITFCYSFDYRFLLCTISQYKTAKIYSLKDPPL